MIANNLFRGSGRVTCAACLHAAGSVAEVPTGRESRHVPQVLRSVSDLEHLIGDFNRLNSVTEADLNINLKHWTSLFLNQITQTSRSVALPLKSNSAIRCC